MVTHSNLTPEDEQRKAEHVKFLFTYGISEIPPVIMLWIWFFFTTPTDKCPDSVASDLKGLMGLGNMCLQGVFWAFYTNVVCPGDPYFPHWIKAMIACKLLVVGYIALFLHWSGGKDYFDQPPIVHTFENLFIIYEVVLKVVLLLIQSLPDL